MVTKQLLLDYESSFAYWLHGTIFQIAEATTKKSICVLWRFNFVLYCLLLRTAAWSFLCISTPCNLSNVTVRHIISLFEIISSTIFKQVLDLIIHGVLWYVCSVWRAWSASKWRNTFSKSRSLKFSSLISAGKRVVMCASFSRMLISSIREATSFRLYL